MKHAFGLAVLVLVTSVSTVRAQDKTTFPSDDEIQLMLTQADRGNAAIQTADRRRGA